MASFAEIANDLDARARLLDRTHMKDHARAMRRGAEAIRNLLDEVGELKGDAFAANDAFECDVERRE
jgi:hypothetical protein